MPRISVTTNDGELVEIWMEDELNEWNFNKSMARSSFMDEITDALARAKTIEERC